MNALPLRRQPPHEHHLAPIGGAQVVPLFSGTAGSHSTAGRRASHADEGLVLRRELFERLATAGDVTVVSAPAGSGKTWLLRSWVAEACLGRRVAWTTVRREERDGRRFWSSVTAALAGIADGERIEEPAVLVIDDLHELQSTEPLASLERFLGDLPGQLRVVLLTRGNPCLGLHRLRVAGDLTELRAADLRFSLPETHELLTASGVALSAEATVVLHERTEGWAAALRLAAISLAQLPDPERFVAEFGGSERTVAAFLRAEVLDPQPREVRDLLVRTCVLETVTGPLADALTGGSASLQMLQELDDSNSLVSAVDVGRSWFRYHPLLTDLLRLELRRGDPTLVSTLHREAARWFELNGRPLQAIEHTQSAGDWAHAARLLADHQLGLTLDGRAAEVRTLLDAFPPHAPGADAELALAVGTALVDDALYEEAGAHVAIAEQLAATVDAGRRRAFDLALAAAKLRLVCALGDLGAAPPASRAVEAALKAQPVSRLGRTQSHRAMALVDLGVAELSSSRFPEARTHLEEALELARRIERPTIEVACLSFLALVATLSGRPASIARPLVEQAASLANAGGRDTGDHAAAAFAVGATTLVWLGRLAEAEECLQRAERALARDGAPALGLLVKHALALVRLGQGRIDDALAVVREAERLQDRLVSEHPLMSDLHGRALRARVRLGDTPAVRAELTAMTLKSRNRAEFRIAAAAVDLAEGRAEHAIDELRAVIDGSAQALCERSAVIEALLYDAATHWDLGDTSAAEASLERALDLAEPEGMLLPFLLVDVRALLERHSGRRTAHATLLSTILDLLAGSSPRDDAPPLADSLSDAELRVVRYLPGNLTGREIASELCVSPNTVRTHLRHIYGKLDVHTRREAVERARALGLLAPAR